MKVKTALLITSVILLTACSEEEITYEEKSAIVESINFEKDTNTFDMVLVEPKAYDKIQVQTDIETLVLYLNHTEFHRLDSNDESEPSRIEMKVRVRDDDTKRKTNDATSIIYLNANEAKAASKKYAELYSETLNIKSED